MREKGNMVAAKVDLECQVMKLCQYMEHRKIVNVNNHSNKIKAGDFFQRV